MTAHSSGAGSSWNETLDIDQPHGLDYREWNDIRIGIRKRMASGHTAFADATVGGVHIPGGAGVLGMEISDSGGDCTPVVDGTYKGRGILWAYDGSTGVLWCSTSTAEATTCDWTVLQLHPNASWCGQDVTWSGAHEFGSTVDITGSTTIHGDLTVQGNAEFSDCDITGDVSVWGALYVDSSSDFSDVGVTGNAALSGDLTVDGTAVFDATGIQFGGSAGTGLFYDPTAYTGGETCTLGNGLIIKMGEVSIGVAWGTTDVSFAAAFPNGIVSAAGTVQHSAAVAFDRNSPVFIDVSTKGFSAYGIYGFTWIAIGY